MELIVWISQLDAENHRALVKPIWFLAVVVAFPLYSCIQITNCALLCVAALAKQLTNQSTTVVQQFMAWLMKPCSISGCTTEAVTVLLLDYTRHTHIQKKTPHWAKEHATTGRWWGLSHCLTTAWSEWSCSAYCFALCGPRQRETQTCPCVRAKFREDSVEDRTPSPTTSTHTLSGIPTLRSWSWATCYNLVQTWSWSKLVQHGQTHSINYNDHPSAQMSRGHIFWQN